MGGETGFKYYWVTSRGPFRELLKERIMTVVTEHQNRKLLARQQHENRTQIRSKMTHLFWVIKYRVSIENACSYDDISKRKSTEMTQIHIRHLMFASMFAMLQTMMKKPKKTMMKTILMETSGR